MSRDRKSFFDSCLRIGEDGLTTGRIHHPNSIMTLISLCVKRRESFSSFPSHGQGEHDPIEVRRVLQVREKYSGKIQVRSVTHCSVRLPHERRREPYNVVLETKKEA